MSDTALPITRTFPACLDLLQGATHLMIYRLGQSRLAEMYLYEARRLRLPVIYDIERPPVFLRGLRRPYRQTAAGDAGPDLRRHLGSSASRPPTSR